MIRFVSTKSERRAEIYKQVDEVREEGTNNEENSRKLCRLFKKGRNNMDDGKECGRPPQSPDLAPSGFHLFLHLKKILVRWSLKNDQENRHFARLAERLGVQLLDENVQNLVLRCDK